MAGRRAGANTPPATGQAFAPPTRSAGGVIVRERRRPTNLLWRQPYPAIYDGAMSSSANLPDYSFGI